MFLSDVVKIIEKKGYCSISEFKDFKDFCAFYHSHEITSTAFWTIPFLSKVKILTNNPDKYCPHCDGYGMYIVSIIEHPKRERIKFRMKDCIICNKTGKVDWVKYLTIG